MQFKLGLLMFVQFFVWGAWYLSVSLYMYEHGMGDVRYYAYTAGPLAAIFAPFFTGLIADRFMNMEKVLGILFLIAGGFACLLPVVGAMEGVALSTQSAAGVEVVTSEQITVFGRDVVKGELFNWIILAHMLCYMPTLGLTASYAFANLPGGAQDYPRVRLWGTLGWIAAGFVLAYGFTTQGADGNVIKAEVKPIQFWLMAGSALFLGVYCFFLPATPAPMKGKKVEFKTLLFADAWSQFKNRSFAVFMICSFVICIPLAAYYASLQQQMAGMGMTRIAAWKNAGTFVEAGMMFLMPFFFRKLGIKKMILIGVAAWIVRYGLFAAGASATTTGITLVVIGILLHGICYDFFFVAGQCYVDAGTSSNIRGQAQSMLVFFTQGLGLFFGAIATQKLAARAFGEIPSHTEQALPHWPQLWLPLAVVALVALIAFALLFKDIPVKSEENA